VIDTIICGDCLEVLPTLEDRSVDMVLADLPYGVTACKWDTPLPLDDLWSEWLRICKGAIVLTATQPFTSRLVMSQPKLFRYEWVWDKKRPTNFLQSRKMPMRRHENILVFSASPTTYNPQMRERDDSGDIGRDRGSNIYSESMKCKSKPTFIIQENDLALPHTILYFGTSSNTKQKKNIFMPTQKPVALFEYLIRTYTNEGDIVLDPTAGSGTTAVACRKTNRHYICIEKEPDYCAIAEKRIMEML